MGAAASTRFLLTPSPIVPVKSSNLDKIHALRLILNNPTFADSFGNFLKKRKVEKILFVKFYTELERLKIMCMTKLDKLRHGIAIISDESSLLTVRDMVLNNSAKIYLLFYPCKNSFDCDEGGLIAKCLLPLLSEVPTTASSDRQSFLQDCHEMLLNCQSSLLTHLIDDLEFFVATSQHFLQFQKTSSPAAATLHQTLSQQIQVHLLQCNDFADDNNDYECITLMKGKTRHLVVPMEADDDIDSDCDTARNSFSSNSNSSCCEELSIR